MEPLSQETVGRLVRLIVETVPPLRIVLFGSAARGDMKPDSDIDVLVVVPAGMNRRRVAQDIYERSIGFGHPLDVVVATPSDLEAYADRLDFVYCPALREGKEIYAA